MTCHIAEIQKQQYFLIERKRIIHYYTMRENNITPIILKSLEGLLIRKCLK